ncbi:MAG TPA: type I polyketide synthase, partial [Actinophytocola sp.]|nr:type I polyketide synthase [Actinophytocola sp.]
RLHQTVTAMIDKGYTTFIEISPHPVLALPLEQTNSDISIIPSLHRDNSSLTAFLRNTAHAPTAHWPTGPATLDLPTYAFDRQRFWIEHSGSAGSWRYQIDWDPYEPAPTLAQGHWLVVGDPAPDVLRALTEAGAQTTVVGLDQATTATADHTGVLSLLATVEDNVRLVQALAGHPAPLWILTRGAVQVADGDQPDPALAAIWGLGRVVGLEHSERWGGLVDLPAEPDAAAATALVAVLHNRDGEDQVAIRPDGIHVRRLVPADSTAATRAWAPTGTALVTGGTGALGGHLARWLADHGAEHLVLVSRRGPDAPGAADLKAELTARGVDVTVAACDVADLGALTALVDRLADLPPIRTVIHAAGVGSPVPVEEITPDTLARELAPKAAGVDNLARLLGPRLDTFVLFSSGSGVWGSGMLAGYAAANAYLDATAHVLRRRGVPATSVAWGAWAGDGMGADEVGRELRRRGVAGMAPARALHELRAVLDRDEPTAVIADIRWDRFAPAFASRRDSPLLARIVTELAGTSAASNARPDTSGALLAQLLDLGDADRVKLLRQTVRQHAAAQLGYPNPADLRLDATFQELGFDSIAVVGVSRRLTEATGVRLPATAVFDHPTPDALARHLCERMTAGATTPAGHPLDELERWLAGVDPAGDEFAEALTRVETIANRLRGTRSAAGTNLAEATDDELFDLVDGELGLR